jgi:hypothetical protein
MPHRDYCKGVRATYNALLGFVASHNLLSIVFTGVPVYILIGVSASQLSYFAVSLYASATYTILGFLISAWLGAAVCLLRVYPNAMFMPIFIYNCIAHWSLIMMIIMSFYGWRYIPASVVGQLIGSFAPLILMLFFGADVMIQGRRRLFTALNSSAAAATTTEFATPSDAPPGDAPPGDAPV